jgi:hypothetical protein
MYVSSRGLSGVRRRGLGFNLASEQPSVVRTAGDTYTEQIDSSGDYVGPVGSAGSPNLTQWLNQNSGKVAIGAAGFFALMLFAKAGR